MGGKVRERLHGCTGMEITGVRVHGCSGTGHGARVGGRARCTGTGTVHGRGAWSRTRGGPRGTDMVHGHGAGLRLRLRARRHRDRSTEQHASRHRCNPLRQTSFELPTRGAMSLEATRNRQPDLPLGQRCEGEVFAYKFCPTPTANCCVDETNCGADK